jgi:type VI secretion system secreted protein VgrG
VTLWDHCFEMPGKHLEAEQGLPDRVAVGEVEHRLHAATGERLEVFDFPGAYAQRFDGVDAGGGRQAAELAWVPARRSSCRPRPSNGTVTR